MATTEKAEETVKSCAGRSDIAIVELSTKDSHGKFAITSTERV